MSSPTSGDQQALTVPPPPKTQVFDLRPRHRREDAARTEALKAYLLPVRPYTSSFALMPNYGFDRPSNLLLATRHYSDDMYLPRGVVIGLAGNTPLYGPQVPVDPTVASYSATPPTTEPVNAANIHLVLNDRTGMGVSKYAIKSSITEADLLERFERARKEDKLPRLSTHSDLHNISITKYRAPGETVDRFAIVVRANDGPAAVKLMEEVTDANPPLTVAQLATSEEYQSLQTTSQLYRDYLAKQTADALGVDIDSKPVVTATSHWTDRVSRQGVRLDSFNAYHDVYNSEYAHDGVLISGGTLNGYTHVAPNKSYARADGSVSSSWTNGNMSAVPTSVGEFDGVIHSAAGIHAARDAESAEFFNKRVHYTSGQPGIKHPLFSEKNPERDDPFIKETLDKSKQNDDQVFISTHEHFVAGVVPDTPSLHFGTSKEIVELAQKTSAKALAVPINHPIIPVLAAQWPAIRHKYPGTTLGDVYASEFPVPEEPLLTHHSAHPDTHAAISAELAKTTTNEAPTTVQTGPDARVFRPHHIGRGPLGRPALWSRRRRGYYPYPWLYPYAYPYPYGYGLGYGAALALGAGALGALMLR